MKNNSIWLRGTMEVPVMIIDPTKNTNEVIGSFRKPTIRFAIHKFTREIDKINTPVIGKVFEVDLDEKVAYCKFRKKVQIRNKVLVFYPCHKNINKPDRFKCSLLPNWDNLQEDISKLMEDIMNAK